MTSVLFLTEDIYCNMFTWNYIRNEKHFLNFVFLNFRNLDSIWNIFKQNLTFIADIFLNLQIPKNVLR